MTDHIGKATTMIDHAFLARNGKSDLQKMQNSGRNGKGEG